MSKIDLSYNELTSQLLTNLKREKSLSKYLKTIVVKGMKMDHRMIKKEGINIESLRENKLELGNLTIEF